MQRGRGGRNGFFGFGNPFPGFGGFVPPGDLMPSIFGGTNPFDDPFFANPFGAMIGPSLFEQSMFRSSMFGPHRYLGGVSSAGGFQQQGPEPSRPKGPIIKELSSDDEDDADVNKEDEKKKAKLTRHPRISQGPYIEEPDEVQADNKRPKHEHFGREYVRAGTSYPQPQSFMFQSSTVTYGGPNGAYYTSSTTRSGGDGVTMEESKEADTTTGKATHRISRGIGNKGHALTRNLNCDGKVNTMQTLHNLNEDELAGFEESWPESAAQNLPGWDPRVNMLSSGAVRPGIREENGMFALPAPDQSRGPNSSRMKRHRQNGSSQSRSRT